MSPLTNTSLNAEKFNDAYFTSNTDVQWCMTQLSKLYSLKGKKALEPAAGSGVFVNLSKPHGLQWITNELYSENSRGFKTDFNLDFIKADVDEIGRVDFVITNPPFGKGNRLARSFVLKSFEFADVVAMVIPKGLRSWSWWDKKVPQDIKIVFDEDLPDSSFLLPDGQIRKVGCSFMVMEKVKGYERGIVLENEPNGYRIAEGKHDWPEWATYGMCNWGSSSGIIVKRGERERMFASTIYTDWTPEQRKAIPNDIFKNEVERTATSVGGISKKAVITLANSVL